MRVLGGCGEGSQNTATSLLFDSGGLGFTKDQRALALNLWLSACVFVKEEPMLRMIRTKNMVRMNFNPMPMP